MTRTQAALAYYNKQMSLPYGKFDSADFHILGILLDQAEAQDEAEKRTESLPVGEVPDISSVRYDFPVETEKQE